MSQAQTLDNPVRLEPSRLLGGLIEYARSREIGMAIWREPGGTQIQGVIDFENTRWEKEIALEEMSPGFLFAPYERDDQPHFIKAGIYFEFGDSLTIRSEDPEKTELLRQYLDKYTPANGTAAPFPGDQASESEHLAYVDLVEKAVKAVHEGEFIKVVPSRSKTYAVKSLNIPGIFQALCQTYVNAFVSITLIPEHGIWMGASPELLVNVSEGRIFETIALAGTQAFRENVPPGDIAWTQKEIEEQALVSRYVINCFKQIRLREFEEIGPKTVVAGNLIHLKTRFRVDMEATGFPQLGSVMLDLLHPTSAICGMPRIPADNWLKENESYEREFFSGFLGPVNIQEKTSLFVNLRCMKISDHQVRFFAGAGITEDSRPEKEWLETEMKMNTLLNVIREHSTRF